MPNASYTEYGPFTNGAAPGINQTFLNALETFLLAINTLATDPNITASGGIATLLALALSPTPVQVTGSVSGTATLYQYQQGTVKKGIVYWANYKSGAAQTLALPVAFTTGALAQTGETQGQTIEFLSGGSPVTLSVLTTLNPTGGTETSEGSIKAWSSAQIRTAFDTIRLTFTGSNASGYMIFEGI